MGYMTMVRGGGAEITYGQALGVTADGGRTWRRHDLGRLTDQSVSPIEESAEIYLQASQVGLAWDGAGAFHVLSAHKAGDGKPVEVRYRRAADVARWTEPVVLSVGHAELRGYPAIVASGPRVHAAWLECEGGWCNVRYRGSSDGGRTWSEAVSLSRPGRATGLLTDRGFRRYSGHYLGVAEDGRGAAHVVWAVRGPREGPPARGEVWHAIVRLRP